MARLDYEEKMSSKSYHFFDLVYRLLVVNVLTVILSCTVILLFPAIVASNATIKEGFKPYNVFKQYFKNLLKFLKKSLIIGLIVIILYAISIYAIYFYVTSEIIGGRDDLLLLFLNAGFLVSFIGFIIILFLTGHLPQLIITFESLTISETFRTSFYVTFRYILTTLIIFILNIVIIGGLICCIIRFQVLAIWLLFGISLPIFLQLKITAPVYYKFSKIDFEKIMHAVEEGEEDE